MTLDLRHDLRLRAAASVIYDTVYPGNEWTPVSFEEAERRETPHYRQAIEAALLVRPILTFSGDKPSTVLDRGSLPSLPGRDEHQSHDHECRDWRTDPDLRL